MTNTPLGFTQAAQRWAGGTGGGVLTSLIFVFILNQNLEKICFM
jgi:hypothetical protein